MATRMEEEHGATEEPGRVTRSMARRQKQNLDQSQDISTSRSSESEEVAPGQEPTK